MRSKQARQGIGTPYDPSQSGQLHICWPTRRHGESASATGRKSLPCQRLLRSQRPLPANHARLGSRLLARLYRDRHFRRLSCTHLQGTTLIEPEVPISGVRLSDWLHCRPTAKHIRAGVQDAVRRVLRKQPHKRTGEFRALPLCAVARGSRARARR